MNKQDLLIVESKSQEFPRENKKAAHTHTEGKGRVDTKRHSRLVGGRFDNQVLTKLALGSYKIDFCTSLLES